MDFSSIFHWLFIDFSLMFHWFFIGCSLICHWCFIDCSLIFHWFLIDCSLICQLEESSASALAVGHYFYTRISYPFGLNVQQTILLTRSVYIEVLTRSGWNSKGWVANLLHKKPPRKRNQCTPSTKGKQISLTVRFRCVCTMVMDGLRFHFRLGLEESMFMPSGSKAHTTGTSST